MRGVEIVKSVCLLLPSEIVAQTNIMQSNFYYFIKNIFYEN